MNRRMGKIEQWAGNTRAYPSAIGGANPSLMSRFGNARWPSGSAGTPRPAESELGRDLSSVRRFGDAECRSGAVGTHAPYQRAMIKHRAFTRIGLAVVIAVIALLACVFLPALGNARRRAQRISCTSQLKMLGLSYRIFANDHGERFPSRVSITNGGAEELLAPGATFLQFRAMSNGLNPPRILTCPADTRRPAVNWASLGESNVSYFVGVDAEEGLHLTLLSGDRNLSTNGAAVGPGLLVLTTNSALGWTAKMHRGAGNYVLGDGSVQQATSVRLAEQVRHQDIATNRLLIP